MQVSRMIEVYPAALAAGMMAAIGLASLGHAPLSAGTTVAADGGAAATPQQLEQRMSMDLARLAGSQANAGSLIRGLHSGKAITLIGTGGSGQAAKAVRFVPPTRPMGYDGVYLALALMQQRLIAQDIARPTPSQLEAALLGGAPAGGDSPDSEAVPGVLQLRSQGVGWRQIANACGVRLLSFVTAMTSRHGVRDA